MPELVRQGEIMLVPTKAVPFGQRRAVRRAIVGHSESGHHHVLECDTEFNLITTAEHMLIELQRSASLTHQAISDRHRTLTVPPGVYRVVRKRQYHPVRHGDEYAAD